MAYRIHLTSLKSTQTKRPPSPWMNGMLTSRRALQVMLYAFRSRSWFVGIKVLSNQSAKRDIIKI